MWLIDFALVALCFSCSIVWRWDKRASKEGACERRGSSLPVNQSTRQAMFRAANHRPLSATTPFHRSLTPPSPQPAHTLATGSAEYDSRKVTHPDTGSYPRTDSLQQVELTPEYLILTQDIESIKHVYTFLKTCIFYRISIYLKNKIT